MDLPRRFIILAGIILVVLIAATLFLSSLFNKQNPEGLQPTLVPTQAFESSGTLNRNSSQNQFIEDVNKRKSLINSLNPPLRSFASNTDFALQYSADLGRYFIQKLNPQASDTALQQFLNTNGLLDLYKNHPELFVITNQSIDQLIAQQETLLAQGGGQQNSGNQTDQTQQELSQTPAPPQSQNNQPQNNPPQGTENTLQPLVDLMKSLVNLDLGPTLAPAPTEPPGGGGGGGGGPPPGGGNGKLQDVVYWAGQIHQRIRFCSSRQNYSTLLTALSNNGYTSHHGVCVEACTYNVIDSYRLAGIQGLTDAQGLVYNMRNWWAGKGAPYVLYHNGSVGKVQPGCAMLQGLSFGAEHAEIIHEVHLDSHNNGTINTYSTNSQASAHTYPVHNGVLSGNWDSPVDFGCLN